MLLRRARTEGDDQVKAARRKVDLAVSAMTRVLDEVQQTAAEAKEELSERGAG